MERSLRDFFSSWSPQTPVLSWKTDTRHDAQDHVPLMPTSFSLSKAELMETGDSEPADHRDSRHPRVPPSASSLSSSSSTVSGSQALWLSLYFLSNLSLTLYNKFVLVRFPFPYTLTALHALCGAIGGYILMERGMFEPRALSTSENAVLIAFSVLYTVNIAVSNLSLKLVTVPFHQVVRAATPIFVMAISYMLLNAHYTTKKLWTLVPVIAGVGFATFGDYYFTVWGLLLTLLGTFLAALKTVFTNVLQQPASSSSTSGMSSPRLSSSSASPNSHGHHRASSTGNTLPARTRLRLQLHPLDLLSRMSPLAFVQCVFVALLSGELERVRADSAQQMGLWRALALLTNGMLAFALNVVSFTANKKVGALSMTVAANVKQVLTILFAVFLFDLTITPLNGLGIVLTIVGGAWYASEEYREKQQRRRSSGT